MKGFIKKAFITLAACIVILCAFCVYCLCADSNSAEASPAVIRITNTNSIIQAGSDNHRLRCEITGDYGNEDISYFTDNPSVAKVSADGYVTGTGVGSAKLTVRLPDGASDTATVVVRDDAFELNRNSVQLSYDLPNVSRIKYGYSEQGRNLEAFVITNSTRRGYGKTLFMDFAVHGFEDSFFRDGTLLVKEAHELINYFARNSSLLGDYRLVIVPCANPDGTVAGVNNHRNSPAAFGRCTAKHFDINRDFNTLEAVETVALKNIIEISSPDVYLNVHGWLDEAVGDKKPCTIVRTNLNLRQFKNNYGVESGFAIGWVHKNLNIPVALVEYASPNSISTQKDINMIRAIIKAY